MTAHAPKNLAPGGKGFWKEIMETYELRADEVKLLESACRELDLIQRLEDALAGQDLMVTGSQGQLVASPLVSELRQHRAVLKTLLSALKLPDTDRHKQSNSDKARRAVNARWKTGQRAS